MPRKGRRQLVNLDEEYEQDQRNEECRRLEIELHREWRAVAFDCNLHRGRRLPFGVVKL